MILQLFGRILDPFMTDSSMWKKEYEYVAGKLQRHMQKWLPNVAALYAARNNGAELMTPPPARI